MDVPDPFGYVTALAGATSRAWSSRGRSGAGLAEAATRALTEVEPPAGLGAADLLAAFARRGDLPAQSSPADPFGQPPLIVHAEEDFYIQALIWMDGTTAIHQHGFAGAFMVLEGSSLHVEQHFDRSDVLADGRLVVGQLRAEPPEILRAGTVRPIEPGSQFIHALFHLEKPTVTMVVRNTTCGLDEPQYSYRAPGLGWDGLWADRRFTRRLQSLDALARLDADEAGRQVAALVASLPLWEAFSLVDHWVDGPGPATDRLVEVLVGRAEPLGVLGPALAHDLHVRRVLLRRGMMGQFHQRLLLALVANLPTSEAVVGVLAELFPGREPSDLLLEWVEELAGPALRGISGLSIPAARLAGWRALPAQGRETTVLTELREAWGEPRSLAELVR